MTLVHSFLPHLYYDHLEHTVLRDPVGIADEEQFVQTDAWAHKVALCCWALHVFNVGW